MPPKSRSSSSRDPNRHTRSHPVGLLQSSEESSEHDGDDSSALAVTRAQQSADGEPGPILLPIGPPPPTFRGAMRVLLPIMIQNGYFDRTDYPIIQWINNVLLGSGSPPWPHWNVLEKPAPTDLPFLPKYLQIRCKNMRSQSRKFTPYPPHLQLDPRFVEGTWQRWPIFSACANSQADLAQNPHLQFFECEGHKLGLDKHNQNNNRGHGPKHWVCSDCAWHEYIHYDFTMWMPERLFMFCRFCCHDQVTNHFATNRDFPECKCHRNFAPNLQNNHLNLCSGCRQVLRNRQEQQMYQNLTAHMPSLQLRLPWQAPVSHIYDFIYDMPNEPARQYCPCGRDDLQILATWAGIPQRNIDREFLRLCLLCGGHQPTSTWIETGYTLLDDVRA